ncbi:hypothetical protein [Marinomonas colpomeniae]|uniref:N-acetyltransferase domain-containing protein n=1 Tax=Marinomonas colpomeniae TaxID=2774408 RepID=A0ABR8NXH4_9GAMM|nr:hypothetical protein [Marinomonas colpomeniae]MBD5770749.1 hypothetical protein [Marinomonas colpomeniae]
MTSEDLLIELKWGSTSLVEEFGEPDRLIYEYYGAINRVDEYEESTRVGKFRAQYVDVVRAINEHEDIFEVMDCHSSSMLEYFDPIFGKNSTGFSDLVMETLNHSINDENLLILDRVELLPEFRGEKIGLKALRHMMTRFSAGAGIVALKAFPLQYEAHRDDDLWRSKLLLEDFESNQNFSIEKLKNYYEKLGFKRLPDTDIMIFSTAFIIPSI